MDDVGGLALGEVVTATAAGVATIGASGVRTALGLGTAAVVDTGITDNLVVTVDDAGGLTNGSIAFATAAGIESKSAADETKALVLAGGYGLLGESLNVDLNNGATVPADVATITMPGGRYRIDKITWQNASAAIGTAQVGIYTGAGATGDTLVTPAAVTLATVNDYEDATNNAATIGLKVYTVSSIFVRLTTAEGAADTADIHVYGWRFS